LAGGGARAWTRGSALLIDGFSRAASHPLPWKIQEFRRNPDISGEIQEIPKKPAVSGLSAVILPF
jgi:hypothetical protein